ncbi:hypothetical protein QCA50_007680 [Cerrena zonata]|uniref:Uncharacterized protein n=1 Tax=Cerrena zonata TaxID=2478898 RepID=A0AAW0GGM4_9APHY
MDLQDTPDEEIKQQGLSTHQIMNNSRSRFSSCANDNHPNIPYNPTSLNCSLLVSMLRFLHIHTKATAFPSNYVPTIFNFLTNTQQRLYVFANNTDINSLVFNSFAPLRTPTLRPTRRALVRWGSKKEPSYPSDVFVIGHELILILVVNRRQVREIDLVSEQTTNSTETLDELSTFLRLVGDEFEVGTELLVLLGEPFKKRLRFDDLLHFGSGRLVGELFTVLLLLFVDVDDNLLCIQRE